MGREITKLSFEQWVKYVFDHPVTKPEWHWNIQRDSWNELKNPALTVSYLTQLFTHPVEVLAPYRDPQINQGFWYLVHNACSSYMFTLQDTSVPLKDRATCLESIYTLFEKLFATRCTSALGHLSEEGNPLNSVCYMWWDLIPLTGIRTTDDLRRIGETALEVMTKILEIKSDACRESALHGLGHWTYYYGDAIRAEIDSWLQRHPDLRSELRQYAEQAKENCIL